MVLSKRTIYRGYSIRGSEVLLVKLAFFIFMFAVFWLSLNTYKTCSYDLVGCGCN